MNWKSTAVVSAVTLAATWLEVGPARTPPTEPPSVGVPRDVRQIGGGDIEHQASRLQNRVREQLEYRDPTRNPFRFAPRPSPPRVADETRAVDLTPAAPVTTPFAYTLSGMATDPVDGRVQRTAILTAGLDVIFAKEGDHVGSYVVTQVQDAGVQLTGADGSMVQLTLRP